MDSWFIFFNLIGVIQAITSNASMQAAITVGDDRDGFCRMLRLIYFHLDFDLQAMTGKREDVPVVHELYITVNMVKKTNNFLGAFRFICSYRVNRTNNDLNSNGKLTGQTCMRGVEDNERKRE